MIKEFLKKLFYKHTCKHVIWLHVRRIYGDEINARSGKRHVYKCSDCGKIKYTYNIIPFL